MSTPAPHPFNSASLRLARGLALACAPLVLSVAMDVRAEETTPPPPEPTSSGPSGMTVVGGVLVGVASAGTLAGAVVCGMFGGDHGGWGPVVFIGLPLIGGGLLVGAIGAPLLTLGLESDRSSDPASAAVPELTLSPTGATARWTF